MMSKDNITVRISREAHEFLHKDLEHRGIPTAGLLIAVDMNIDDLKGLRRKEQNRQKKIEEADLGFA